MKVKDLKKALEKIPNDVEVFVNTYNDGTKDVVKLDTPDFCLSRYEKGDSYVDIIVPVYIVGKIIKD